MIDYFINGIKRWSDFEGRSNNPEFWWFLLAYYITFFLIVMFGSRFDSKIIGPLLLGVFLVIMFIPKLSLSIRRLHDTGKSGWYYLLGIIPLVGSIIMLVLYLQPTEQYANKWGPVPGEDDDDDLVNSLVGDNE